VTPSDTEHPSQQRPSAGVSTRLSASEIHENVAEPAREEMERTAASLLMSAFQSGLAIAFSFLAGAFAASLVAPLHAHAAAAAAYPLGFILVILARSELFTENTLRPVMPLLEERSARALGRMLRLWGLLLAGNLAGAAVIGWVLARTAVVEAPVREQLDAIAAATTSGGFGLVFYRAIFAGWLIALLTWMLAATHATGAQLALIWLCTAPIAALHFRHSIAGAVEAFYRVADGSAPLGEMIGAFVVPAVLGNTVGGVVLVALLSYAQVASDEPAPERRRFG
jgi:formate/nitrite transporter FocA (FNT family)